MTPEQCVSAWRRIVALHAQVDQGLADALQPAGLSTTEFVVLDALAHVLDAQLRMQQIALISGLSRSATTRLVSRMTARGLIERVDCEEDGRGVATRLTGEGHQLHSNLVPVFHAALKREMEHAFRDPASRPIVEAAISELVLA